MVCCHKRGRRGQRLHHRDVLHPLDDRFAILASGTPPVCITAYAGAALAGANPLRTSLEAFALALGGFVVPYVFYFDPALLMQRDVLETASSVLRLLFMIVMLSIALQGWWEKKILPVVQGGLVALAVYTGRCGKCCYFTRFFGTLLWPG